MSENETVNVRWRVGVVGSSSELDVIAAYIHQWPVGGQTEVTLKDADHKIVFQGPREHVQYARRRQDPDGAVPAIYVPTPPGTTPNQIRELQDELNKAAAEKPGRFIVLAPGSKVPPDAHDLVGQVRTGLAPVDERRAARED